MPEDKSLEQFLQELMKKEQERHEQLVKEHYEFMQMIEEARKEICRND